MDFLFSLIIDHVIIEFFEADFDLWMPILVSLEKEIKQRNYLRAFFAIFQQIESQILPDAVDGGLEQAFVSFSEPGGVFFEVERVFELFVDGCDFDKDDTLSRI